MYMFCTSRNSCSLYYLVVVGYVVGLFYLFVLDRFPCISLGACCRYKRNNDLFILLFRLNCANATLFAVEYIFGFDRVEFFRKCVTIMN